MSLFQTKEWWSTTVGSSGTYSQTPLLVGNVDNESPSQDKIVVGTLAGDLKVYHPQQRESQDADVLLDTNVGAPVLQLALGDFSGKGVPLLAILNPRRVLVAGVTEDDQGQLQLKQVMSHAMKRTAANMVTGPFGNAGCDVICVQSMDGVLTFYKQAQEAMVRYLPSFLLPGPIAFLPATQTLVTANSTWTLQGYKFRVLAAASEESSSNQQQASQQVTKAQSGSTGKQITAAWQYNLGEEALEIHVCQTEPQQLLVLGTSSLFWLSEEGKLLQAKRLEVAPNCVQPFRTEASRVDALLGAEDGVLRVLQDRKVVWAAGGVDNPVALATLKREQVEGLIVVLDNDGRLSLNYLGTDPSLPTLAPVARELDHEALDTEMQSLQRIIRAAAAGKLQGPESNTELIISHDDLTQDEQLDFEVDDIVFTHSLTLSLTALEDIVATNVCIRVLAPSPIACDHMEVMLHDQEITAETTVDVRLAFGLAPYLVPSSLAVKLVVDYAVRGHFRSAEHIVQLPLSFASVTQRASKQAQHKLTVITNKPPLAMRHLFPDMVDANDDTPALGLCMHGSQALVSIIAAKSSGRYRVQSDDFASLAVPLARLMASLQQYHKDQNLQFEFHDEIPTAPFFELIDKHHEVRLALNALKTALDEAATQYRLLQKRLLTLFKDTKPVAMDQFTALLEGCYHQLLALSESYEEAQNSLFSQSATLAAGTQVVHACLRLQNPLTEEQRQRLEACIPTQLDLDIEQGWEEHVLAATQHLLRTDLSGSDRDSIFNPPPLSLPGDTTELKSQIAAVCRRIRNWPK
eukprot:TRINITY_DN12067_c0_g1_i1.p1 TRINITY_DN12067_c0_g1~~TRINITY_DN12067_c0_g1_i1.p1  ORF type:complete len:803 (+),score=172.33 TRINITY_DN12067_c0_g1_i1:961-3369(+)